MNPTLRAHVKGGIPQWQDKRLKEAVLNGFEGKDIDVTFAEHKNTRTDPQRKYYWSVLVVYAMEILRKHGNDYDKDQTHYFLLDKFSKIETLDRDGAPIGHTLKTTSEMTTAEFSFFKERIQQWGAEEGFIIPDPDKDWREHKH